MLRFGGYLLRFHLASDWWRNNKHSEIFSAVHGFMGKTVRELPYEFPVQLELPIAKFHHSSDQV